jgi:hypothetical protein
MILYVRISRWSTLLSCLIYYRTDIMTVLSKIISISSYSIGCLIYRLSSQTLVHLRLSVLPDVIMRLIQWILNDKIISLFLCLSKQSTILLSIYPSLCWRHNRPPSAQALIYIHPIDPVSVIQITVQSPLTCLAHWLLLHNWWKHSIDCRTTGQHPSGALSQRSTFIQLRFEPLILFDVLFPVLAFESGLGVSDRTD